MPKLLQINSVVNTGSTGRIAEQLGQMVMAHGWESYIAYGREARDSKSHLIKIGNRFQVYFHALCSKYLDNHGLMSYFATRSFLKELDILKPDVVHLHNIHGYYLNYPLLFDYLSKHNIPTIITMHDFWLMTGHCAYINKSCDRWKNECGNCPRLDQYPSSKVDKTFRNLSLKASIFSNLPNVILVPVSRWLGRYADVSILRNLHQEVIYNGIDINVFKPFTNKKTTLTEINWQKFTIMSIATRWTEANGFFEVLKLSNILPDDCQIVMVGVDDEQIKSLPSNVIGLKKTESFIQLQELYSKSDVIFNPNTEVTFGLVTVEAMACGTPAVVLRDTAGEELVDDETGFVIDRTEQVLEIIPIIKRMNKEQVANACRQRVSVNFEAEKQYQKYFDLYNKLVKNRE